MQKSSHAHDDHHEAFDPEPVQHLSADETPSPAWLPVVGGGLLLVAAGWAFYPGPGATTAPTPTPPPSAAAAAPVVSPKAIAPSARPTGARPDARKLIPSRPTKPAPPKP